LKTLLFHTDDALEAIILERSHSISKGESLYQLAISWDKITNIYPSGGFETKNVLLSIS
jgi:hypothetical protein